MYHCNHGINRDPQQFSKDSDGPWYYEQIVLGYNYCNGNTGSFGKKPVLSVR